MIKYIVLNTDMQIHEIFPSKCDDLKKKNVHWMQKCAAFDGLWKIMEHWDGDSK